MKKEEIIVPKDKCPLDVLAEMGEQAKNAWLFLHRNAYRKLLDISNKPADWNPKYYRLMFHSTENYPETEICICSDTHLDWFPVYTISASNITFKMIPSDPEDIFLLKMEE